MLRRVAGLERIVNRTMRLFLALYSAPSRLDEIPDPTPEDIAATEEEPVEVDWAEVRAIVLIEDLMGVRS